MMQRATTHKYRDFLLKKNLRYTLAIIATLYFIFLVFIAINSCTAVYFSVKSKENKISEFLERVYTSYQSSL